MNDENDDDGSDSNDNNDKKMNEYNHNHDNIHKILIMTQVIIWILYVPKGKQG